MPCHGATEVGGRPGEGRVAERASTPRWVADRASDPRRERFRDGRDALRLNCAMVMTHGGVAE